MGIFNLLKTIVKGIYNQPAGTAIGGRGVKNPYSSDAPTLQDAVDEQNMNPKYCPQCAEKIKQNAKMCHYCRYSF